MRHDVAGDCPCQRCTMVTPETVATFQAAIAVFGYAFHIIPRVLEPSVVMTLGLSRRAQPIPELLVTGMDPDDAQPFLRRLVHKVREGRDYTKEAIQPFLFSKAGHYARSEVVKDLPDAEWDAWFALGTEVLGGRFPVVQITISDRNGLFWDDTGVSARLRGARCIPGQKTKWALPQHQG